MSPKLYLPLALAVACLLLGDLLSTVGTTTAQLLNGTAVP